MKTGQRRLATLCGHVYHDGCVRWYASRKGIPLEQACPMRCHRSSAGVDLLLEWEEVAAAIPTRAVPSIGDELQRLMDEAVQNAAGLA